MLLHATDLAVIDCQLPCELAVKCCAQYCLVMLQVRVTDADKDVPLYVVIRKWVQNDPDAELMPLPAHGDDLAEAKRSLAPKLPPVPPPSEEET